MLFRSLAPSVDLAHQGWSAARLAGMWSAVADPAVTGAQAAAFAAGGLLAMLADSLMPFAYERGGAWAGIFTVIGFAVSLATS